MQVFYFQKAIYTCLHCQSTFVWCCFHVLFGVGTNNLDVGNLLYHLCFSCPFLSRAPELWILLHGCYLICLRSQGPAPRTTVFGEKSLGVFASFFKHSKSTEKEWIWILWIQELSGHGVYVGHFFDGAWDQNFNIHLGSPRHWEMDSSKNSLRCQRDIT